MRPLSQASRIGRLALCLLTVSFSFPSASAAAERAHVGASGQTLTGDLRTAGPTAVPQIPALASQILAPSILAPVLTLQPAGVQPIVKNSDKPATTPLQGLLRHGADASLAPQIKSGAGARDAVELNFMQSAALADPHAGGPDVHTGGRLLDWLGGNRASGLAKSETKRTIALANGMKVQLESRPDNFSASIAVAYDVGGRDEPQGETGYTHFVEHLMFQGTTRIKNWFRMVGTMGAETNAATYRDHTIYTQSLPFNMLQSAIALEAERMLHLEVTPEKVEREKRVILEEKAGRDSGAYVKGWDRINELLFVKKRNHSNVIGSENDIRAATAEKLNRYLKTYYTPDRAHVVIKGRLGLDETEAWVRRYFGAIPARKTETAKIDLSETTLKQEARAEILDGAATSPAVLFGWLAPQYKTADYYAAGILTLLLNHRLQQKLILQDRKALGAGLAMPYLDREPGAIMGSITLGPDLTPDAALTALDEEISRAARGDIDSAELAALINVQVAWAQNNLGASDRTALAAARGLTAADLEDDVRRWAAVTAADLRHAASSHLRKEQRALVTAKPGGQPTTTVGTPQDEHGPRVDETPTDDERALLKELAQTQWPKIHYKPPVEFTLDNGLKVIVQPDSRVPTVYAKLAFRLGQTAVDAAARGKAPLVAQLLRLKTAEKDESTMNNSLQAMRATVQVEQAWDHVVLNGNAPSDNPAALLSLMAEIVTRPNTWTDAELAPYKAWWKEIIKGAAGDPNSATNQQAVSDLLGGHPAARGGLTPQEIDSLSASEFVKLVSGHFAADNAVLVVAGKVDPAQIKKDLASLFGAWKPGGNAAELPSGAVKPQETISLLDRPGAEQSLIRLSAVAVDASKQSSPDHFPMLVANAVLGGGLASRLNSTLRQSLGLAYNTFSNVITDPTFAMLTLGAYTRAASTGQALDALLEQVRRLREEPVDELELGAAKNALVSSFIMGLDSIGNIADGLLGLELFNQPLSLFGLYPQKVSAVTAAQVQQSAAKMLDPQRLAITVSGDAAAVESSLSKVRPVVEYTADGAPKERPSF
jgi:zinc protease